MKHDVNEFKTETGGYFNLNLKVGKELAVTVLRGRLFQGSTVREKKNLLVFKRTGGLMRVYG